MLHLYHHGRDVEAKNLYAWVMYEATLEQVALTCTKNGVKTLIFKTTNWICETSYGGDFAKGIAKYNSNDPETLERCYKTLKEKSPNAEDVDVRSYCSDGTINNRGVDVLNRRLLKYVTGMRERFPSLDLHIYNDHDVSVRIIRRERKPIIAFTNFLL